jgi:HD superfamily phosphohydrolase
MGGSERAKRPRVVLDPVYGYIRIPPRLTPIIDHPLFQRLRRLSQTSLAHSVYPSLTGTRFEHSLGVMHLAAWGWNAAWGNSSEVRDQFRSRVESDLNSPFRGTDEQFHNIMRDAVAASALLHDVGHPPFSHALESFYLQHLQQIFGENPDIISHFTTGRGLPFHELAGELIADQILERIHDTQFTQLVSHILRSQPSDGTWAGALHGLVAGELDVDRLDYLMRDAKRAGTEYGAIDYARLLDALEIRVKPQDIRIGPGVRARSAAEMLLVQRAQSYKWVYFHPRIVAADLFLDRALTALYKLISSDEAIETGHVGNLFQRIAPPLNFIGASRSSLDTALGLRERETQAGQLNFEPKLNEFVNEADWSKVKHSLQADVQATADDSAVIVSLSRGYLLSRFLRETTHPYAVENELLTVERYYRAVFLRAKNFYPAWKSYEEYVDVATRLVVPLKRAWSEAIDTVSDVCTNRPDLPGATEWLAEFKEHHLTSLDEDAVLALNHLSNLLIGNDSAPSLASHLGKNAVGVQEQVGVWDATFRDFRPLKRQDETAFLYRDTGADVALSATSPLVAALEDVEGHRIKLFVYYFLTGVQSPEDFSSSEFRGGIRDAFIQHFPDYVKNALELPIKELLFEALRRVREIQE